MGDWVMLAIAVFLLMPWLSGSVSLLCALALAFPVLLVIFPGLFGQLGSL